MSDDRADAIAQAAYAEADAAEDVPAAEAIIAASLRLYADEEFARRWERLGVAMDKPVVEATPMSDRADEIAREERRRIGRALALMRDRGMDVAAPWEGDLDDLECERYEAIAAALRAYGREMLEAIAAKIGDNGHISGLDLREFTKSKPEAQDTQT